MRGNKSRNTKPELRLRSALHRAGLRYNVDRPIQVGDHRVRPDVVFPRLRIAVFVDSCFWHCCPAHGHAPKSNTHYWEPKLARNRERDRRDDERLAEGGWTAVRVWEHESAEEAAARIGALVAIGRGRTGL
jgi:DNA mismatch endonuclease (patch repair protein)